MDDAVRETVVGSLVRDPGAAPDSIEIARQRVIGNHATTVALWNEARTGPSRRGAVDAVMTAGVWRAHGGWSSNADHDSDHPVWLAWGGSPTSVSGWVSDAAAATVRFRDSHGRIEADTIENSVAILIYDTAIDDPAVIEVLDADGKVLHTAPLG